MKNILKTTIFAFLLISLGSCTNDKEPIAVLNGFELRDVSESAPPSVLSVDNANQPFIDLEWDKADYGVPTGNTGTKGLTYKFIITDRDKPEAFVKSEVSFTRRDSTLTVKQFNVLLSALSTFKCTPMNVEIRVESTLGNVPGNQLIQISTPIALTVTAYPTKPKELAFVKDLESPTNAPKILSSSFDKVDDFEGYMYLEPGNYKFYMPDACGDFSTPAVYGGSGGNLEEGTSAPSINVATAGHYYVTADLTAGALKYTVQYYKAFGIYGLGVKGKSEGVQNAVPMSDDTNSNVWKITFDLFKGKGFKFKSNDWIGDLSGDPLSVPSGAKTISVLGSFSDGILVKAPNLGTSGQIKVPGTDDGTRQQYEIVIDVSKPRNYTYTLTIK
jgi:hypothetical protein